MKQFKDFGINPTTKYLIGDKIKIYKIFGKQIIVHDFKIEASKCFQNKGSELCLYLQFSLNDEMSVVFTSAKDLIDRIQKVPNDGFPFATTIIKKGERYVFD